jgi:SPP1 gp7 family putative phage head morphogenesis protein
LRTNAELSEKRNEDLGLKRYVWVTSRDERVRKRHVELDGTEQKYAEPPIVDVKTGRRANPGLDFACRCSASVIVDDILAALEE